VSRWLYKNEDCNDNNDCTTDSCDLANATIIQKHVLSLQTDVQYLIARIKRVRDKNQSCCDHPDDNYAISSLGSGVVASAETYFEAENDKEK
jgi:hypothetical protein